MELENFWVIQTKREPIMYAIGIIPTEDGNTAIVGELLSEAMSFIDEQSAQLVIDTFVDSPNWFGARPPRKPKPHN